MWATFKNKTPELFNIMLELTKVSKETPLFLTVFIPL